MRRYRSIIAGCGVQAVKRKKVCGKDFVGFVDPLSSNADFNSIEDVPIDSFDLLLACIPDEPKSEYIKYCLKHGKHILVEKPLFLRNSNEFEEFSQLSEQNKVVCYTAYNHRFEPHFIKMKNLISSGKLGDIYRCRIFYGNGTARLVRESEWRDQGAGVLADLGSHLLDTIKFWFGEEVDSKTWKIISANNFENLSLDHVVIGSENGGLSIEMEMTMLSWRNHFTCDIIGENGSAHIESLCKWGPSKFIYRKRELPSGRPNEEQFILIKDDPTWVSEYEYFKALVAKNSSSNFLWDKEILDTLKRLESTIKG